MTDILAPAPPAAAVPSGLTGEKARRRLAQFGPNETPDEAVSGHAVFYVVRERKHLWSSRPSLTVNLCSIADLLIIPTLAVNGILMTLLPFSVVAGVFVACIALALVLDQVKLAIFARLRMM